MAKTPISGIGRGRSRATDSDAATSAVREPCRETEGLLSAPGRIGGLHEMSTRTPMELIAALARYALVIYQGKQPIYRHARTVQENLTRPADELLAEQNKAAAHMVNHAYENSPYYHRKYSAAGFSPGDVKSTSDFEALPTITRQELIDHIDDIVTRPKDKLEAARTGGTTGVPLQLFRTSESAEFRRGIDLALTRYYGWKDGEWRGWLWAAAADLVRPTSTKAKLINQLADRQFFLDARSIDRESVASFLRLVEKHHPTFVSAYPSLAYTVADFIDRGLVDERRVPVISLTAEPLYDFQREKIARCFADEVFERYGSREIGTAAIECRAHCGLHVFTESVFLETVPTESAAGGRLLATDLVNTGMPLIRYETGDCAEIDDDVCACGHHTPRLKKVLGREVDAIVRPDGSALAGLLIAPLIRQAEITIPVQVVQKEVNHFTIRVAGDLIAIEQQLNTFVRLLRRNIGGNPTFRIEQVDYIERPSSGKYRYVLSHVTRRGRTLPSNSS